MGQLTGWILYNRQDAKRNARYIEWYKEEGRKLDFNIQLLYIEKLSFGIACSMPVLYYDNKKTILPDFAIVRMNYPLLSKQLELLQIAVFNNSEVATISNDKAVTYQYVATCGIKVIDSQFIHRNFLMEHLKRNVRPYVVKAVSGHGGSQVFLVTERVEDAQLKDICNNINDHAVLQPLIGDRHQDLRVYVIGKEIVGAVLRTASKGFKSNYSLGGTVKLYRLNKTEISQVNKIISLFDFGLVGIDFLIGNDGELIFNEIEDVVGSRMLYQCSDINIVAQYLSYIGKRQGK